MIRWLFILCASAGFLVLASSSALANNIPTIIKPRISIVVDDLGDNSIVARQVAQLPVPLTMAILPQTPHARKIAAWANANGHDVIMHLPMEATSRPELLGPGALLADMSPEEMSTTMQHNIDSIPNLVGFNNHMGSLLTKDASKMHELMRMAKRYGWYFLDSKTTQESVAEQAAESEGVLTVGRDIFLDHHIESAKPNLVNILQQQFAKATKIAIRTGQVVIICHPYPETVEFLQQQLHQSEQRFEFVTLSQLLGTHQFDQAINHEQALK